MESSYANRPKSVQRDRSMQKSMLYAVTEHQTNSESETIEPLQNTLADDQNTQQSGPIEKINPSSKPRLSHNTKLGERHPSNQPTKIDVLDQAES